MNMFDFKTAAAAAGGRLSAAVSAILARRVVMPLLYADERMLRDIGLSRADIIDSLAEPLGTDPSQLLIARINKKRKSIPANDAGSPLAPQARSAAA
jgi:hypothetical protein